MDFIQMAVAISLIAILVRIEYRSARVYYTPFILLACPYAAIFFVQWYSIRIYDLSSYNPFFFLYMLIHLFLVWLIDMLYFCKVRKKSYNVAPLQSESGELKKIVRQNVKAAKIIEVLGLIASAYMIFSFVKSAKTLSMIGKIVQEDFQLEYSGGLGFYARLICMVASVYFFSFVDKKRKRYLLYGTICLIPNILTFVKGSVFICIVAGILGNTIVHNRRLNLKTIGMVGIAGVLVFFGVYLVEICIWEPEKFFQRETYEYIFAKLNFYLISGVQGFNERLVRGSDFLNGNQNPIFAPIVNLIAKTGLINRIDTISNEWTVIGDITNYGIAKTNTYSFVGVLVLYLGGLLSIIWELFIAIVEITLFSLMVRHKKIEYFILYVLFASVYILGWFNYYLMLTFWVYLIIMMALLALFTNVFRYRFTIGRYHY